MAVRLTQDMLHASVEATTFTAAQDLLTTHAVGEASYPGGGVSATVQTGQGTPYTVWVGVVDGVLTSECDCTFEHGEVSGVLCAHALALSLRMLDDGFAWPSAATPPSASETPPQVRELTAIAVSLPHHRLARIAANFAARDRRLEARLMAAAGRLGALTEQEARRLHGVINSIAQEATSGKWDLPDIVAAGEAIIGELEALAERPASERALLLVEHAAEVWDELATPLFEAWRKYEGVPEEIGERIRRIHLSLCEKVQPDPDELAERVDRIVDAAEVVSCLDCPEDYRALL